MVGEAYMPKINHILINFQACHGNYKFHCTCIRCTHDFYDAPGKVNDSDQLFASIMREPEVIIRWVVDTRWVYVVVTVSHVMFFSHVMDIP